MATRRYNIPIHQNVSTRDTFIDMISILLLALLAVGLVVGVLAWIIPSYRHPRTTIANCAAAHGYTIVRCDYRTLRRGPFFRWGRHNQVPVYYIVVVDHEGLNRAGWAKCDYPLSGWGSLVVEVQWDRHRVG